jgi:hypothetical protein
MVGEWDPGEIDMISHISFQQVEILIQDDPGGLNMD